MSFRLYEIEGGQLGEGQTFKMAVGSALTLAASDGRLTESLLPLGHYDLSRPELSQKITLLVQSKEEAVLAEVFPFEVLKALGGVAIMGNKFRVSLVPPLGRTDPMLPFVEPIFSMQDSPDRALRVHLFMAVVYTPDKVND